MVLGAAVMLLVLSLLVAIGHAPIAAYRYATGRAAGVLRRAMAFTGGVAMSAGALIAINEITVPLFGVGIAPRERTELALVEMYEPGLFLMLGIAFVAFGWGIRRVGAWAEDRLTRLLRRQGRDRDEPVSV
jgi:hypothetical protein